MNTPLEIEVTKRFGVLPNFFRLASSEPAITANLWAFAQFAYLDNPLPSLFKERLFVYLSRFCKVRYCIARHVGFLVGLGYPAGDSKCLPQNVELILPLLLRPLPHGDELLPLFATCAMLESPLSSLPAPDSPEEEALFACATHVFLQTADAVAAHKCLHRALGTSKGEYLNLLLAFVRTAHYWTKLHPELAFEEDVNHLLATHESLSECIFKDPAAAQDGLRLHLAAELASLKTLRKQHRSISQAYQELSVDHQYLKYNLHETEENLRELVSVMPAAICAFDKEGVITYFNQQAAELWGRSPGLDDLPWAFLDSHRIYSLDGTLLPLEDLPLKEVLTTGKAIVNREFIFERTDLARINLLANITPLRDASGGVRGGVSILQNITELKRMQQEREAMLQELERSNRELSAFSYAVSHDLQAPVRGVRTLTQLLARQDHNSPEGAAHLLALIERSASGMERLIESLLCYAQAGQGQLHRRRVSVEKIIESVCLTLTPLIGETGGRIIYKPLPEVDADPVLLEQLFQNLIANALHYRRPGESPVVDISMEKSLDAWQFVVKDNGQGIPVEYQDRIFEPLKRLHGGETPGSGLGLACCRTVVNRHGGQIWVESEGDACGSTFRFTLSAQDAPSCVIQSSPS